MCIFPTQVQFIHCIKQYEGNGGDSLVTDGLQAAHLLRENHPEKYQVLTSTPVDWFDEGADEVGEFLKVLQLPMIWLVCRWDCAHTHVCVCVGVCVCAGVVVRVNV